VRDRRIVDESRKKRTRANESAVDGAGRKKKYHVSCVVNRVDEAGTVREKLLLVP